LLYKQRSLCAAPLRHSRIQNGNGACKFSFSAEMAQKANLRPMELVENVTSLPRVIHPIIESIIITVVDTLRLHRGRVFQRGTWDIVEHLRRLVNSIG
jgi:hypothetical protein